MRRPSQKVFLPVSVFVLFFLGAVLFSQAADSQTSWITEEEVRQFLEHHKERYTRKDIDGFVSQFSSKAVQNGRDGFNEIKGIYSDFIDQSQELRYHLEGTRIKIYR
jgi:hypothetical protein